MKQAKGKCILCLVLGILFLLYFVTSLPFVGLRHSLIWIWAVGGLFFLGLAFLYNQFGRIPLPRRLRMVAWILVLAVAIPYLFATVCIFTHLFDSGVPDLDYIIVLGARVKDGKPSKALLWRINAAEEYLRANPNTVAILSGGQGPNESISEAACMYNVLTARGIDQNRLCLEDKSTDTNENLRNSFALTEEDASVGIVTNNFHVYRATRIANHISGRQVHGIATPFWNLTLIHYMVREVVGIYVEVLEGNMTF